MSARTHDRIPRVARDIAALPVSPDVRKGHVSEAIGYCLSDKVSPDPHCCTIRGLLSQDRDPWEVERVRIPELYGRREPTISFEFFPPKNDEAEGALFRDTVPGLQRLRPAFISVTYGAGGGTRERSFRIVDRLRKRHSIEAMAHLTCVGATRADSTAILDEAEGLGIENILALRGDPPKGEAEFRPTEGGFRYAAELVRFVKARGCFSVGRGRLPRGARRVPRQAPRLGPLRPESRGRRRVPHHPAILRDRRLPRLRGLPAQQAPRPGADHTRHPALPQCRADQALHAPVRGEAPRPGGAPHGGAGRRRVGAPVGRGGVYRPVPTAARSWRPRHPFLLPQPRAELRRGGAEPGAGLKPLAAWRSRRGSGGLAKRGFGQVSALNLAKPSRRNPLSLSPLRRRNRRSRGVWPNYALAGQTPPPNCARPATTLPGTGTLAQVVPSSEPAAVFLPSSSDGASRLTQRQARSVQDAALKVRAPAAIPFKNACRCVGPEALANSASERRSRRPTRVRGYPEASGGASYPH